MAAPSSSLSSSPVSSNNNANSFAGFGGRQPQLSKTNKNNKFVSTPIKPIAQQLQQQQYDDTGFDAPTQVPIQTQQTNQNQQKYADQFDDRQLITQQRVSFANTPTSAPQRLSTNTNWAPQQQQITTTTTTPSTPIQQQRQVKGNNKANFEQQQVSFRVFI